MYVYIYVLPISTYIGKCIHIEHDAHVTVNIRVTVIGKSISRGESQSQSKDDKSLH